MFNGKSKSELAMESHGNSTSLIGTGTTISGDLQSSTDIRIDGTIIGNIIATARVIIGPNGVVEGNIEGLNADVLGKVTGNIKVTELLQLKGNAVVNGNIHASKLQLEPSVSFNGQCHMLKVAANGVEDAGTGKNKKLFNAVA